MCYLHVLLSLVCRRGGRWWSWVPHTKIFKGNWGTQVRNVSFVNSHHFKVFEEVPFDLGPFCYGQRRYLCCFVWICLKISYMKICHLLSFKSPLLLTVLIFLGTVHYLGPNVWMPISTNPVLNFNPSFFFYCSKAFSWNGQFSLTILFGASNQSLKESSANSWHNQLLKYDKHVIIKFPMLSHYSIAHKHIKSKVHRSCPWCARVSWLKLSFVSVFCINSLEKFLRFSIPQNIHSLNFLPKKVTATVHGQRH